MPLIRSHRCVLIGESLSDNSINEAELREVRIKQQTACVPPWTRTASLQSRDRIDERQSYGVAATSSHFQLAYLLPVWRMWV